MCSSSNTKICLVSITKLLETIQTLLSLYLCLAQVIGTWEVLLKRYNKLIHDEKLNNVYIYVCVYHYMSYFLENYKAEALKFMFQYFALPRVSQYQGIVSFAEVTLSYPSVSKTSLGCPWLSKPNQYISLPPVI